MVLRDRGWDRGVRPFRTLSIERRSRPSPGVRIQAGKGRNWHGLVKTCLSN